MTTDSILRYTTETGQTAAMDVRDMLDNDAE